MDSITLKAYAKINLFLEVCEKRPDSYHNIDSIMQAVTLCDVVTVSKGNGIILSNNKGLPNDRNNLAYRAAESFFDYVNLDGGATIHIEKNIPVSAGLAGGSTDAAAVLKALNELYQTDLDVDTLCKLGSKLGADVPFCIRGGCYVTKGIGDVFTPCASLPYCYIVISKMGEGVSTPAAYGMIDKERENSNTVFRSSDDMVTSLEKQSVQLVAQNMYNIFESVVSTQRPMVYEQKQIMENFGAIKAMMSGSGPSVFGVFESLESAEEACNELRALGADVHICNAI